MAEFVAYLRKKANKLKKKVKKTLKKAGKKLKKVYKKQKKNMKKGLSILYKKSGLQSMVKCLKDKGMKLYNKTKSYYCKG